MAIDYCVALDCEPKRKFGNNDCRIGTDQLLERLKARDRAAAIRQVEGVAEKDPQQFSVTLEVIQDGKSSRKTVTLAQLDAEAAALNDHSQPCAECCANVLRKPYGCVGVIHYPITSSAEQWLLNHIQSPGTFGATLLFDFINEFHVTGDRIREMRQSKLFENNTASRLLLKKGLLRRQSISADQLLEAMLLACGTPIAAGHCLGVLLWLDVILVDGLPPHDPASPALKTLAALKDSKEKAERCRLRMLPATTRDEAEFAAFLKAMFVCWVFDVPLLIWP